MLRIANLLRGRIPKRIVGRAGIPNWDRPDPPPSAKVPVDHQLSDQQIIFTFQDGSMPQHILTQPQVYEGDTLLEASPSLIKVWGYFLGVATLIGLANYIINPLKSQPIVFPLVQDRIRKDKQTVQNKQWLKWGNENPLGLKLSSQTFPYYKFDYQNVGNSFYDQSAKYAQTHSQINKQVQHYLKGLKQRAQKKVQQRLSGHTHNTQSHYSQGHQSNHSQGGHQSHHSQEHSAEGHTQSKPVQNKNH